MTQDTVIKKDKSPVTVADLSAQALISLHLLPAFPKDEIIGEEDTSELRRNETLCDKVVDLVNEGFTRVSGPMQNDTFSKNQILDAIDKGSAVGGPKGRFWTIVRELLQVGL